MADRAPFSKKIINRLEDLLTEDFNEQFSLDNQTLRVLLEHLLVGRSSDSSELRATPPSGFLGQGFRVRAGAGLQVRIENGFGFQWAPSDVPVNEGLGQPGPPPGNDATLGVNDLAGYKPIVLAKNYPTGTPGKTINLDPPPGADTRIDIIEVRYNRAATDQAVRRQLDPSKQKKLPIANMPKTVTFALDNVTESRVAAAANSTAAIGYKTGLAAASPSAPATTPGYLKIAEIWLAAGAVAVDDGVIADWRTPLYLPYGSATITGVLRVLNRDAGTLSAEPDLALSHVNAPPGVRVFAVSTDGVGAKASIYILAGDTSTEPPYQARIKVYVANRILDVRDDINVGTVDNATKLLLEGANVTPSGQKVCLGQRYVRLRLQGVAVQNGGTLDQTQAVLGNNVDYMFHVTLGR